ncbi:hypothetical protein OZK63_34625, partial [Streptomyces sp. UMAF16]|nr:hypothetical protein [Streptomyces sp. UMAF16]
MTRTVPAPATADASRAPARALTVLVVSQVLGGAGMAAGITVGALLAPAPIRAPSDTVVSTRA